MASLRLRRPSSRWALSYPVVASSLYLGTLGLLSCIGRREIEHLPQGASRVVVVIPAHNESSGIKLCVERIRRSDHTGRILRIIVIADNCTDDTAMQAAAAGAEVMVRVDADARGKGEALAWALSRPDVLEGADYIMLFDADDHPDADAIDFAVGHAQAVSADVVQLPHISGLPEESSDSSAIDEWTTTLMNRVRSRGLHLLGLPCRLQGGGMLLSVPLIHELGWPSAGVSEDFFATLAFLDAGARIEFCDAAQVRAQSAHGESSRRVQRVRWESGRLRAFSHVLPLLRTSISQRSANHVSMAAYIVVPPLTLHVGGLALLWLVSFVSGRGTGTATVATISTAGYMAEGLRLMSDSDRRLRAVTAAPRFAVWKYRVYRQAVVGFGSREWVRTPRSQDLAVPGHQVGDSRLAGGCPPSEL